MKRALIALTLTTAVIGLSAVEAHASGPLRKWLAYGRPTREHTVRAHHGHYGPVHGFGYTRYESVEDAFPRYIGAFHSRYFNDLGVAPGDVGIRTNGITLSPW